MKTKMVITILGSRQRGEVTKVHTDTSFFPLSALTSPLGASRSTNHAYAPNVHVVFYQRDVSTFCTLGETFFAARI